MPGGATQLCLQSNLHPLARTYGSWIQEQILICALLTPLDFVPKEAILVVSFLQLAVHFQTTHSPLA